MLGRPSGGSGNAVKDAHVTIYDVAKRAGVSAATASRALAGLKVNAKNREAVEKAAADLGYVPNEAARSLRVVRTMTVGMVFNELTGPLGMELLGALSSALDARGYSLFVSTAQGDPQRYEQLVRRFLERRVDALVCVHGRGESPALERYLSTGVPALSLISHGGAYARLPLIKDSIAIAAEEAFRDLKTAGHQRMWIVTAQPPTHLAGDVFAAARSAGIDAVELPRPPQGIDPVDILEQAARPGAPTVILTAHAEALRLADAVAARPSAPPLHVVALRDRNPLPPGQVAPLPMIYFDPAKVGTEAALVLQRWLEGGEIPPPVTQVSSGSWRP